jgi:tRNA(Met) C34 N-acetyltransferase TmcA
MLLNERAAPVAEPNSGHHSCVVLRVLQDVEKKVLVKDQ